MLENLVHYFNHIPSLHRTLILAGGITFFWLLEGIIPLFRFSYNKWRHALVNIFFTLTTVVVNFLFAVLIVKTSDCATAHHFGILYLATMPLWLTLLLGLLLLDLIGAYWIHYIEHKVKWMWKFHVVHHADTHVDTTTANRHHPGESVFRAVFTLLAVFVCGAPVWLVMVYQSMSALLSQFNHANIRFPRTFNRVLNWVIVSPDMHKVHHHYVRPQTDSNYGNIFSIWDHLFGTYNNTAVDGLHYGLDVLDEKRDEELSYQMGLPFNQKIKTDY